MFLLIARVNKLTGRFISDKHRKYGSRIKFISAVFMLLTVFSAFSFFLTGCGKNVKKPVLPPDVYYKKALYDVNRHNYSGAAKNYKALIENYPTYRHTEKAELKLGDAYYLAGKFIESEGAYLDFIHLHPRSKYASFAMFFAAMSNYKRKENTGRNQEPLKKAKAMFEKLISRYPYSKYSKRAFKYIKTINTDLSENTFYSGLYYYNASLWKPAAYMFRTVTKEYPKEPIIPKALYYLAVCYRNLNNAKMENRYKNILIRKYPQSKYAKML